MTRYRHALPQLSNDIFLTDGGIETTLIFHQGLALPCFAAFDLLSSHKGRQQLREYYAPYLDLAVTAKRGLILESPTWRANADWGDQLGYNSHDLAQSNQAAIELMQDLRNEFDRFEQARSQQARSQQAMVISGCVGPRGDGYRPTHVMDSESARQYHSQQIQTFADTQADMVTAITMNYVQEAIGITLAAQDANMPVVISFTTETDGRLPSGDTLQAAIQAVDKATNNGPAYYMINCAHPDHFASVLQEKEDWVQRIKGLRANASRCSHAELDEADSLDEGCPSEFGQLYAELRQRLPHINVLGGCCGTDARHIRAVSNYC